MADVVAAPHDHVVADLRVGLNDVRFQYQAILADIRRIDVRVRVDERGELVMAALAFEVAGPPELVDATVAERPEQLDLLRRKRVFELFPGHQRQIVEALGLGIFGINREADDAVFPMRIDIDLRDLGDLAGTEDDNVCHAGSFISEGMDGHSVATTDMRQRLWSRADPPDGERCRSDRPRKYLHAISRLHLHWRTEGRAHPAVRAAVQPSPVFMPKKGTRLFLQAARPGVV